MKLITIILFNILNKSNNPDQFFASNNFDNMDSTDFPHDDGEDESKNDEAMNNALQEVCDIIDDDDISLEMKVTHLLQLWANVPVMELQRMRMLLQMEHLGKFFAQVLKNPTTQTTLRIWLQEYFSNPTESIALAKDVFNELWLCDCCFRHQQKHCQPRQDGTICHMCDSRFGSSNTEENDCKCYCRQVARIICQKSTFLG